MLAAIDARQEEQGRVQQEQGQMLAKLDARQEEQGRVQDEQGGTLAMLSRHFGVLVENSARMQRVFRNDDERLRSRVYIFTGDSQGLLRLRAGSCCRWESGHLDCAAQQSQGGAVAPVSCGVPRRRLPASACIRLCTGLHLIILA